MAEEFGGRQRLEEAMEKALTEHAASERKKGGKRKLGKRIDRVTAERMVAGLEEHDSKIIGGRMTGGAS